MILPRPRNSRICAAPLRAISVAFVFATGLAAPVLADDALDGMDVVSLRDAGRVATGGDDITTHWRGREWHFTNEANRATFESNPRAYAPGFGGNCPVALAAGERRAGSPTLFVVVDDTLYLTSTANARDLLTADPDPILSAARTEWKHLAR